MKKLTVNTGKKKKYRQGDEVFASLAQQILDQTHVDHHFQLVEEDGEPCTTLAAVEARLKALVLQEKPMAKRDCNVTVVSTYCIKNNCPNACNVQLKTLSNIIGFRKDGNVNTRVCVYGVTFANRQKLLPISSRKFWKNTLRNTL